MKAPNLPHWVQVQIPGRCDVPMARREHERILQDTEREQGHTALRNNVRAALALADAVRSTIGPLGLDKMLLSDDGDVQVTNDGVTVLEAAKVEHPTARMLISTSSVQDDEARDGTSSAIVLTAELLLNALDWIDRGIHPSVMVAGYRIAMDHSLIAIEDISKPMEEADHIRIVSTSLAGKVSEDVRRILSNLAVETASIAANRGSSKHVDPDLIKRIIIRGGRIADSERVDGIVLRKTRLDSQTPNRLDGGKVLLLDGGLDPKELSVNASIRITEPGMMARFLQRQKLEMKERVDAIAEAGIDLLIVRDGIHEDAIPMLRNAGIVTYRRVERIDLELIARACGARIVRDVQGIRSESIGEFNSVNEERWESIDHVRIHGSVGSGQTVVLRGSTDAVIDEVSRAFDDAIGVACGLQDEPKMLPGGGAIQIALARRLRAHATTIPGREQLAVEAYAAALESIPRALAENSGLDGLDQIIGLTAAQTSSSNDWLGIDVTDRSIHPMNERGVLEPVRIARQAITGATESAISVLRIGDILWAKQDAQMPDWQSELGQDED